MCCTVMAALLFVFIVQSYLHIHCHLRMKLDTHTHPYFLILIYSYFYAGIALTLYKQTAFVHTVSLLTHIRCVSITKTKRFIVLQDWLQVACRWQQPPWSWMSCPKPVVLCAAAPVPLMSLVVSMKKWIFQIMLQTSLDKPRSGNRLFIVIFSIRSENKWV